MASSDHHCSPPLSAFLALALLAGCQPSSSQEPRKAARENLQDEYSVPKPSATQLLESTAPGYVTLGGTQQECLGRLVFDVLKPVEWPVVSVNGEIFDGRKFSENVEDGNDRLKVGKVEVATVKVDAKSNLKEFLDHHEGNQRNRVAQFRSAIESHEKATSDRKRRLATASAEERQDIEGAMADDVQATKQLQADLAITRDESRAVDFGIPGSIGFWENGPRGRFDNRDNAPPTSIFFAYIERKGYVYAFKSVSSLQRASHQEEFLAVLKHWRPRAAGEIPKDLGVCIPYGFIADDGRSPIFTKMSLRYHDAPGVLYTIQTSNVDPKLGPETTTLTAASRALAGNVGTYEKELVDKYVTKKIGPQIVKIGALTAQQGGFAAQKPDKDGKPMNVYSVFTGYGGWQDTFVLPSILVDMRSYTRLEAPELTVNPPPFEQSMERLNALLKSIRLRPTEPSMPELANLPAR